MERQYIDKKDGYVLLKITSIILIIFGVIIVAFFAISLSSVPEVIAGLSADVSVVGERLLYISLYISLLEGVLFLICGILGVKFCRDTKKAVLLIVFGALSALSVIASTVFNISTSSITGSGAYVNAGTVIGLLLPLVYIIGAVLNLITEKNKIRN